MTSILKSYVDLELRGSTIYGRNLNAFPVSPRMNEQIFKDGILWIWTTIEGLNTWYPLTNKKGSYVHTQGAPNTVWTVNHNLNSTDFIFMVYDDSGVMVTPSSVSNVAANSFQLNFGEASTGRAVVFFESEMFVPALSTDELIANSLNIAGNTVTANSTGLFVNGLRVALLDANGNLSGGAI